MENPENQPIPSRREATIARLKERYPDKSFEDDEEVFGQISDDYDAIDSELNDYKKNEKALSDMFAADPRSAYFLQSWRDGEHPMTALVRQFGKEGLQELVENEDKMEEFAKANEEYLERVAKEKELEEQYQTNLGESIKTIESFQTDNGLSDDEVDKVVEQVMATVKDGIVGKFSRESLESAWKSLNYDADVEEAGIDGEVRGRNAKIDEKLRKRDEGDGTVSLDGKNGGVKGAATAPNNIFDLANEAR
jgi:hypothetical protein